jgi:hypothetical protein
MTDAEFYAKVAAEQRLAAAESRWMAQGEAIARLAELAYDEDDWAVGDALRARATDLLSLIRD